MLAAGLLAGCGQDRSTSTHNVDSQANSAKSKTALAFAANDDRGDDGESSIQPVSAVKDSVEKEVADDGDDEIKTSAPSKNSPEWFILQITRLKVRPLGDQVDTFALTAEKQAELRRERNEQLVDLATEAIARTHKDQSKERVFDLAVHHLLEAELQLALAGDKDHVDALYEHASSLYDRDRKSKSAVEAGQTLITLARLNAQRYAQQEPRWLEEYGRLARQFAKNFPQEERQAVAVLFAAGQSCEFHNLATEAIQCYAAIRDQFPENDVAQRVVPILRRLNLKGHPLKLAGPTLGGGYIDAAELAGKPLLVIFWTTQAQPFVRQLGTLKELLGQISTERLSVVSVNLDDDDNEAAVQAFLESNGLHWQTIFQSEADKRGWNNPIATHYGIQSVPLYWVVSSKGNVVETSNNVQQIEPLLRKLITPPSTASENTPK